MRKVFDETRINGMPLQNRLVRSATWEGMCNGDGRPDGRLAAFYANLAHGRIGLIISGYSFVAPAGRQLPGQMGAHSDEMVRDLSLLPRAVHPHGSKICLQLVHAGGQTTAKAAGETPVAPSAISTPQFPENPRALNEEEIETILDQFAAAAGRGKAAGFDAVQIHAAHGYLINQFLSPLTNEREDSFGGSMENRSRLLIETYRRIRRTVGNEYPVLVKLNGSDNLSGGFDIDEAVLVAKELDNEGIDAIEVSGGTPASGNLVPVRQGIETREQEAYNLPLAVRIKNAVTCPVMVVGGLKSYETVEGIIRRGEADYAAMARPFIREPHLVRRWESGDETRARCISCNGCFKPGLKEKGIYCVVDRIEQESRHSSL